MNYQQLLASALVIYGSGDEAGALAELDKALAEAARVDPEGPRVAEVLNYVALLHRDAGRSAQEQAVLARVAAIWARFPEQGLGPA